MEEDLKEVADLLVNPNTIELGLKLLEDRFGFEIVFRSMGNDEWRKFWNQHKYSIFLLIGDFRVRLTYVDENILIKLYNYLYDIDITKCRVYFDEHYASFPKNSMTELEEILKLMGNENTHDLGVKLLEDRFNCRVVRKGDVLEKEDRELRYSFYVYENEKSKHTPVKPSFGFRLPSSIFKMFQFSTIEEKENFHELLSLYMGRLVDPSFEWHYPHWINDPNRSFIMKPVNPKTEEPFGSN